MDTDRAPQSRVWQALTRAEEFGAWFAVKLDGAFTPGAHVVGKVNSKKYGQLTVDFMVERLEHEHLFSYRWHPIPIGKDDFSKEPTTLVEFHLSEVPGGTRLTVIESGFYKLPPERRADAFRSNRLGRADEAHRALCRQVAPKRRARRTWRRCSPPLAMRHGLRLSPVSVKAVRSQSPA